jgi:hypothetical protein
MKWIRSVTLFLAGIAVGALLTQSIAAQNRSTGHDQSRRHQRHQL